MASASDVGHLSRERLESEAVARHGFSSGPIQGTRRLAGFWPERHRDGDLPPSEALDLTIDTYSASLRRGIESGSSWTRGSRAVRPSQGLCRAA